MCVLTHNHVHTYMYIVTNRSPPEPCAYAFINCMLSTSFTAMFYYLLGNINPKYRSRLKLIQLVCVANAEVIKCHGIDAVLKPLISDIQKLEKV